MDAIAFFGEGEDGGGVEGDLEESQSEGCQDFYFFWLS